jgi:hypothetical protein
MNAFRKLIDMLEEEGYREIEDERYVPPSNIDIQYTIVEEEDTGRRYKITIEEV